MTQNIHSNSNKAINDAFRIVSIELTQGQATRLMGILAEKEDEYTTKLIRSSRPNGTQEELADWARTEQKIRTISHTREELTRALLGEEMYALIKSER
jgi:hypothetical protein